MLSLTAVTAVHTAQHNTTQPACVRVATQSDVAIIPPLLHLPLGGADEAAGQGPLRRGEAVRAHRDGEGIRHKDHPKGTSFEGGEPAAGGADSPQGQPPQHYRAGGRVRGRDEPASGEIPNCAREGAGGQRRGIYLETV